MSRTWEAHQRDAICDVCGERKSFVWDFYGDLVCDECAEKAMGEPDAANG